MQQEKEEMFGGWRVVLIERGKIGEWRVVVKDKGKEGGRGVVVKGKETVQRAGEAVYQVKIENYEENIKKYECA